MDKRGFSLLLLLLLLLGGCGKIERTVSQPEYKIGVVLKAMNSQYWMEIRSGMEQAAADRGADLLLLAPYDEKNVDEQKEHIRSLLEAGIDVLLVAPCNSYDTAWFVSRANEEDIPVLTVDTRAFDSSLPYIGSDNKSIGRMAAGYFVDNLPPGAQIAVLSGSRMQSTHTMRVGTFLEELSACGLFPEPKVYYTDGEFSQGYDLASELGKVDGLFCTSAVLGLGAVTAQSQSADTCPIIAVDTQDDALEAVRSGALDALITQTGYETGYQAIENALDLLGGKTIQQETLLGGQILTSDNIDDYTVPGRGEELYVPSAFGR